MKNTIRPVLSLPEKKSDIAQQTTAIIPVLPSGPITPIPPAVEIRPFFRGIMPLPPSVNEAYKVVKISTSDGRIIHRIGPTADLEKFKQDAALLLLSSSRSYVDWLVLNALRAAPSRSKTPLGVIVDGYFLSEWRRDLDGILKHAIDATFEFLRLNDNLIVDLHARKLVDQMEPRVEIEVRCLAR